MITLVQNNIKKSVYGINYTFKDFETRSKTASETPSPSNDSFLTLDVDLRFLIYEMVFNDIDQRLAKPTPFG